MIKMVKGLLHWKDPAIDSRALSYRVEWLSQFHFDEIWPTIQSLQRFVICEDVVQVGFILDKGLVPDGMWYFRFYQATNYLVVHWPRGGSLKSKLFSALSTD